MSESCRILQDAAGPTHKIPQDMKQNVQMVFHIKNTVPSNNLITVQYPRLNTNLKKNIVKEKRTLISHLWLCTLSTEHKE